MNPFQEFVRHSWNSKESKKWSLTSLGMFDNGHQLILMSICQCSVIAKYFREWQKWQIGSSSVNRHERWLRIWAVSKYARQEFEDCWFYHNITHPQIPSWMIPGINCKSVLLCIHSPSYLDAYQSKTDYDGLNSGTLEVVSVMSHADVIGIAY